MNRPAAAVPLAPAFCRCARLRPFCFAPKHLTCIHWPCAAVTWLPPHTATARTAVSADGLRTRQLARRAAELSDRVTTDVCARRKESDTACTGRTNGMVLHLTATAAPRAVHVAPQRNIVADMAVNWITAQERCRAAARLRLFRFMWLFMNSCFKIKAACVRANSRRKCCCRFHWCRWLREASLWRTRLYR